MEGTPSTPSGGPLGAKRLQIDTGKTGPLTVTVPAVQRLAIEDQTRYGASRRHPVVGETAFLPFPRSGCPTEAPEVLPGDAVVVM